MLPAIAWVLVLGTLLMWEAAARRRSERNLMNTLAGGACAGGHKSRVLRTVSAILCGGSQRHYDGLGLIDSEQRRVWEAQRVRWYLGAALGGIAASLVAEWLAIKAGPALFVAALGAAHLIMEGRVRARRAAFRRSIEYHLPLAIERLIIAVHSGLDLLPAIAMLGAKGGCIERQDPLSRIFQQAADAIAAGAGCEQVLRELSERFQIPALRHVCIHLGLAAVHGGELFKPLRELGDATRIQYQEAVEEEIARLPGLAVVPLILTFTGMILLFLTAPLLQIVQMTAAMHAEGLP